MTVEIQSLNSSSTIPHLSQFSPENIEIQVAKEKHSKLQSKQHKPHKRVLHCSKCRRPLVICNADKCSGKKDVAARKSLFKNISSSSGEKPVSFMFGSYVNGSNNVACHQDALLLVMSEIFNRHPEFLTSSPMRNKQQTKAFQALNRAWNLNCNDKLHDSKIILLSWLQNETCNGRIYYRLGNQCSLEGTIHSLYYYMTQEERKFFSFVTSVSRKCCKFGITYFHQKKDRVAHLKLL